jgi:hypothetical protein
MQNRSRMEAIKRIFALPGADQPEDFLYLLLLAFCYGAYFLLVTVAFYIPGKVVESEEFLIYVQGWITVPVLVLLAVFGVRAFKQRLFPEDEYFYPLWVAVTLLTSLICTFILSITWMASGHIPPALELSYFIVILFPVLQILALGAIWKIRRWLAGWVRPAHTQLLKRIFPFAVALFLINFCGIFAGVVEYRLSVWTVILAVVCGTVLQFNPFLFGAPGKRGLTILIDVLAAGLIILVCFDPLLIGDIPHNNFYLGPVNAIIHGKTILVDVYSQYGVFVMEFLAGVFKLAHVPISSEGVSFVDAVAVMAQFGIIYFMMRVVFKSVWYAIVGLVLGLLLNVFATQGVFQAYPSIGPFRFGLCYVLLAAILLRVKYPRFKRASIGLEYGVLGLASIWSFETFVYVVTIFVVSRVYQTLLDWQDLKKFIRQILMKLGAALGSILLFQAAQALYIFIRAGQWPNWGIYLNYLFKYSVGGLGTLPVDPWSPWFYLVMIYFIFIVGVGVYWLTNHRPNGSFEVQTLLYLSFMGVAQLTYFVGRSHPNNLFHICLPAVFIALYGFLIITRMDRKEFSGFSRSSALVCYAGLALITIVFFPNFFEKLPNTALPTVQSWIDNLGKSPDLANQFIKKEMALVISRQAEFSEIRETVGLIEKYAAQQPRVAVFIAPLGTTQAVILSRKAHLYPISDPVEDSLSPQVAHLILDPPTPLRTGDIIFLSSNPKELTIVSQSGGCLTPVGTPIQCIEIQLKAVDQLCSQFGFDEIESTPDGASAFRLTPHGSGTSDYCHRLNTYLGLQDN